MMGLASIGLSLLKSKAGRWALSVLGVILLMAWFHHWSYNLGRDNLEASLTRDTAAFHERFKSSMRAIEERASSRALDSLNMSLELDRRVRDVVISSQEELDGDVCLPASVVDRLRKLE